MKREASVLKLRGKYLLGRKELALVKEKTLNFPSSVLTSVLTFHILGPKTGKRLLQLWSLSRYSLP